ncbi:MAG: hypothetical protein JWM73_3046 [Solirubrobacterales bacterium]|jgi:lysozyme family protein|nr:hypothetical protein [Solirubrobacterales bacterium]
MLRHLLDIRRAVAACALLGALVLASPAEAVKVRHRGPAVALMQSKVGAAVDGVFGPGTLKLVKRFQRAHGLTPDGIVGPATWTALGVTGNRPVLKRLPAKHHRAKQSSHHRPARHRTPAIVSRGAEVRIAQRRLGVTADGVFGPGTLSAVKAFQRNHGLTADGVVGPATWSALGVHGRHPVLKRGRLHRAARHSGIPGAVSRAISAANRIANYPYRYGGGHASFTDSAYDCSGSVSYVLHAAGKLRSPLDSSALESYGAAGPGRYITIYANAGHAYMVINGRRFDTSARYEAGSRWTHNERSSSGYVVRHPIGL